MSCRYFKYLRVEIQPGLDFILHAEGAPSLNQNEIELEKDISGFENPEGKILYDDTAEERGLKKIILYETVKYYWKIIDERKYYADLEIVGTITEKKKTEWVFLVGKSEGSFRIVNYLGTLYIKFINPDYQIDLDVISKKIDFETEYRAIVESIAYYCNQLLLEWDSPTMHSVIADSDKQSRILIEKFLFIRHILKPNLIDLYRESISRNPDSRLFAEEAWKPFPLTNESEFYKDPTKFGRDWKQQDLISVSVFNNYLPEEVLAQKKFESFDTPANRFIKFALQNFIEVCEDVIAYFEIKNENGTASLEAKSLLSSLESFSHLQFFKNISRIHQLPMNNQVLQKREGYKEILRAWLMLQLASRLDWPGRENAYDGNSRNTAVLYEYWLYFTIHDVLKNNLGLVMLPADENKEPFEYFIKIEEQGTIINLMQGKESLSSFVFGNAIEGLKINFYYNRKFLFKDEPIAASSYSKPFRPDFSLIMYPQKFYNEEEAIDAGQLSYLHFDAKYRIEKITELFGSDESVDQELDEEQTIGKSTNTYKRADLYKMHTYNEAIKKTVGSYVLYPGTDSGATFKRYHELLPGVGAFSLRPKLINDEIIVLGEESLASFLSDVFKHQSSKFSQQFRVNYWVHDTIKKPPNELRDGQIQYFSELPADDTLIMLGYMRPEDAEYNKQNKIYYFYARKNDEALKFENKLFTSKYFVGYNSGKSFDWLGIIESFEIKSFNEINSIRFDKIEKGEISHYFLVRFSEIINIKPVIVPYHRIGKPKINTWGELMAKHSPSTED